MYVEVYDWKYRSVELGNFPCDIAALVESSVFVSWNMTMFIVCKVCAYELAESSGCIYFWWAMSNSLNMYL